MIDTNLKIDRKMRQMILRKSGCERLKMGADMFDMAKKIVLASILSEDSSLGEAFVRRELFLRFYGNDFDANEKEKILKYFN